MYSPSQTISVKSGNTFSLFCSYFNDNVISTTSNPSALISTDSNNDLKLGSDNKLVSQPNDTNFLAYYMLTKG